MFCDLTTGQSDIDLKVSHKRTKANAFCHLTVNRITTTGCPKCPKGKGVGLYCPDFGPEEPTKIWGLDSSIVYCILSLYTLLHSPVLDL